jgi:GTP cyclohydrolase FolE2
MRDIHAMAPATGRLMLQRVGIEAIRKPVSIQRRERVVTLSASFSVSVDLPSGRKGSDLSRNAELLAQAIDWPEARPVPSLEAACATIARERSTSSPAASHRIAPASRTSP